MKEESKNHIQTDDSISHAKERKHFISFELKKNFLLLVITLFFMLIFLEVFLRIFYPQRIYNHCYESELSNESTLEVRLSSYFGWFPRENYSGCTYQPDTNKIIFKNYNSQSLRSLDEIPYENGDKKRVLLLGDSFVDGFGLNDSDTISVQLEKELGEEYEVFAIASSGYGTGQELLIFEYEGLKYDPDIVMVFFYQNDFSDTVSPELSFADKPVMYLVDQIYLLHQFIPNESEKKIEFAVSKLSKDPSTKLLDQIINPNQDNHYIIDFETIFVENLPTQMKWNHLAGEKDLPLFVEHPSFAIVLKYSHLCALIYHKSPKIISHQTKIKYDNRTSDEIDFFLEKNYNFFADSSMFLILKIFGEFERETGEKNIKFIVVNIPEKRNINTEYQKKFLNRFSDVNASQFEFKKVDQIFNGELPKYDVEYISLFDLAESRFDEFYFKTDAHWSPEGVKLSAEYISEQLRERKII